jgi:hypothetical protein
MGEASFDQIAAALDALGLIPRSGFHARPEDDVPARRNGGATVTVILVGNAGPDLWRHFAGHEAGEHALDGWCRRTLTPLARDLGADIVFPFEGPPHPPFLRWARRAEGLSSSPIGPLMHPEYGLWHAYRGALLFGHGMELPPVLSQNPCDYCADRPCLNSCPVAAFSAGAYDVPACAAHLRQPEGGDCLNQGCRARRACPIGRDYHYAPAQAHFHMAAFLRNY